MTAPPQGTGGSLPPDSHPRRRAFLVVSGLVCVAILVVAREVLLPFLFAIVLSYVLSPVVHIGERIRVFGRRAPRWVVVVCLYVALLGSLVSVATFSAPRLVSELTRLAREAPKLVTQAKTVWIPEVERRLREASALYFDPLDAAATHPASADESSELVHSPLLSSPRLDPSAIQVRPRGDAGYEIALPPQGLRITPDGENAYRIQPAHPYESGRGDLVSAVQEALGNMMDSTESSAMALFSTARKLVLSLSHGIFTFVMTLMISAYILITSERILEFFRSLYLPTRRHEFDVLLQRIDRGLAGVVRGQLIICLVNGVLSGIGFWALDLKYWVFLTVLATVMSIIPIFGSILSTIPAVLIALPSGIGLALLVLGWVVAIHQIEANFLNPKIMGDAARVHPVLVVFALLMGEHLAGIVGALLAVPVLSITQTLFLYLRERYLGVTRLPSIPPPAERESSGQTSAPELAPAIESVPK